jgi:ferredoxin
MSPRGGFSSGGGRGQGRGGGRGQGGGRGMGQGGGRGMGQGLGRGRGGNRGMRQGMGRGMGMETSPSPAESPHFQQHPERPDLEGLRPENPDQEIKMLRAQADTIMAQFRAINARISELQGEEVPTPTNVIDIEVRKNTSDDTRSGRTVAIVDEEECVSCGICTSVCPEGAITMNDIAVIDSLKCTGCGLCADECPSKAISLAELKEVAS